MFKNACKVDFVFRLFWWKGYKWFKAIGSGKFYIPFFISQLETIKYSKQSKQNNVIDATVFELNVH
jgi:hypothetical protein